jgi:predicted TPR repeat methyltransferase
VVQNLRQWMSARPKDGPPAFVFVNFLEAHFPFDQLPEERRKFAATLDRCGPGPFDRALELGCSVGTFTELLAPRCRSLLAVDVSQRAVDRTRARLSSATWVRGRTRSATSVTPIAR